MTDQQFCLRWNNHQSTLVAVFDGLLEKGVLVDCTLAAEGQQLTAHKVVLAACSPFLETLLSRHYDKHPILILKDVKFSELKAMMDYMYRGEVNISQDQLGTFLKAAESLQIKGLSDGGGGNEKNVDSHPNKRHHDRKQHRPNSPLRNSLLGEAKRAPYNLQNSVRNSLKSSPLLVDIPEDSPVNRPHDGSMSPVLRKKKRPRDQDENTNNTPKTENLSSHEVLNNHQENSSNSLDLPNSVPVPRVPSPSESKQPSSEPHADKTELKQEMEEEEDINEDSVELTLEDEDLGEPGPSHNDGEFGEFYGGNQDGDHRDGQASKKEEIKFNSSKLFNPASQMPEEFNRSKDAEIKKALNTNLNLLNEHEFNLLYNKLAESNLSLDSRNGSLKLGNLIKAEDFLKVKGQKNNHKNGNISRKNWRFSYQGQDVSIGPNYAHVEFENSVDISAGKLYSCSTCKKKYRWKSTLRRHEMVECGGKEPSFQCPQCPYKAKQRGNLGVHMRKYHSNT